MAQSANSWELPIDTGEIPQNDAVFDAMVVGGGQEVHPQQVIWPWLENLFCYSKRPVAQRQNMW